MLASACGPPGSRGVVFRAPPSALLADDEAMSDAENGEGAVAAPRPAFVLHEHHKPRHHFDLRLEEDGVLRSWALPRGLPDAPSADRLAVQVPDHDLDHLAYQDADKTVADTGWWEEHDRTEHRILLTLHGRLGPRRYALIRTARGWLLHLTKDQPSSGKDG